MTSSLPPFSGDDTTCAKCGHSGASTEYREYGICHHDRVDTVLGYTANQRLHRTCQRCGYRWDEAIVTPAKAEQP